MCSMRSTTKDITTGRREKSFSIHFPAACSTTAAFSWQKRDQGKLRGYVILPSGLTHVGNLSRTDHEFRY